jgi:hypothetical protein
MIVVLEWLAICASSSGFLFARLPLPLQLGQTAVWQKIFDCQSRMGRLRECTMSKGLRPWGLTTNNALTNYTPAKRLRDSTTSTPINEYSRENY